MGKVKETLVEKTMYNRANPRFKSGQFHRHKKHGYVIRLIEKGLYGKWVFEIVKGSLPTGVGAHQAQWAQPCHRKPSQFNYNKHTWYMYSRDNLYANFEPFSGPGAEVLFGTKQRD